MVTVHWLPSVGLGPVPPISPSFKTPSKAMNSSEPSSSVISPSVSDERMNLIEILSTRLVRLEDFKPDRIETGVMKGLEKGTEMEEIEKEIIIRSSSIQSFTGFGNRLIQRGSKLDTSIAFKPSPPPAIIIPPPIVHKDKPIIISNGPKYSRSIGKASTTSTKRRSQEVPRLKGKFISNEAKHPILDSLNLATPIPPIIIPTLFQHSPTRKLFPSTPILSPLLGPLSHPMERTPQVKLIDQSSSSTLPIDSFKEVQFNTCSIPEAKLTLSSEGFQKLVTKGIRDFTSGESRKRMIIEGIEKLPIEMRKTGERVVKVSKLYAEEKKYRDIILSRHLACLKAGNELEGSSFANALVKATERSDKLAEELLLLNCYQQKLDRLHLEHSNSISSISLTKLNSAFTKSQQTIFDNTKKLEEGLTEKSETLKKLGVMEEKIADLEKENLRLKEELEKKVLGREKVIELNQSTTTRRPSLPNARTTSLRQLLPLIPNSNSLLPYHSRTLPLPSHLSSFSFPRSDIISLPSTNNSQSILQSNSRQLNNLPPSPRSRMMRSVSDPAIVPISRVEDMRDTNRGGGRGRGRVNLVSIKFNEFNSKELDEMLEEME